MNFEFFIARRILSRKSSGFSRTMLRIALGSISLGLAVMIVSVAMVIGFQSEIRDKVSGFSGHIHIQALSSNISDESNPVEKNPPFLPYLKENRDIRHIQAVASKPGILRNKELLEGIVFKGIDGSYDPGFFLKHLQSGRFPETGDSSAANEVLISEWLANRLELKTNDLCDVYFTSNNQLRPRRLKVTGIYNTGLFELDKQLIVGDMIHIQRINGWTHSQCGGHEVFLHKFRNLEKATSHIRQNIDYEYDAINIRQKYMQIFQWLDLLDMNVYIIIGLMILVAAINMITTLLIIIIEKTTLIGTLKSQGSPDWSIRKIFLYNAAILISHGLLWGNLAGLGFCIFQQYTGFIQLNPESYYVSTVPISINWLYIVLLNAGTIFICLMMMLIPSHIITRITPVNAIKTD